MLCALPLDILRLVLPPDPQTRAAVAQCSTYFRDMSRADPGLWYFSRPHLRLARAAPLLTLEPLHLPHVEHATLNMEGVIAAQQACVMVRFASAAPRLRTLRLVQLTPPLDLVAVPLTRLKSLETLELELDYRPDDETYDWMSLGLLGFLSSLKKLVLRNTVLVVEDVDHLPQGLTSLTLHNMGDTDSMVMVPNVRELVVSNCWPMDGDVGSLTQLTRLLCTVDSTVELHDLPDSLEWLHVEEDDTEYDICVSPGNVETFNLPALTRLQHLHIGGMTNDEAFAPDILATLTGLTSLSLSRFGAVHPNFIDFRFPRLSHLMLDVYTTSGTTPKLPRAPLEVLCLSSFESGDIEHMHLRDEILPTALGLERYPALHTLVLHSVLLRQPCPLRIPSVTLIDCIHPPDAFPRFESIKLTPWMRLEEFLVLR